MVPAVRQPVQRPSLAPPRLGAPGRPAATAVWAALYPTAFPHTEATTPGFLALAGGWLWALLRAALLGVESPGFVEEQGARLAQSSRAVTRLATSPGKNLWFLGGPFPWGASRGPRRETHARGTAWPGTWLVLLWSQSEGSSNPRLSKPMKKRAP